MSYGYPEITTEFTETVAREALGEEATARIYGHNPEWFCLEGDVLSLLMKPQLEGRISVTGLLPGKYQEQPYGTTPKRITCAHERGAEVIARDIRNRLLPEYAKQWQEVRAHVDQFRKVKRDALALSRKLVGESGTIGHQSDSYYTVFPKQSTLKVWRTDPITVDLSVRSLTPEQAAEVLAVLDR